MYTVLYKPVKKFILKRQLLDKMNLVTRGQNVFINKAIHV